MEASAKPGSDYNVASGTLTFSPGQTSKAISVQIIGDQYDEDNEEFSVHLSNPTNASIPFPWANGLILDDDSSGLPEPPPAVWANAFAATRVGVEWHPVSKATTYEIYRRSAGSGYVLIGTSSAPDFVDNNAIAGNGYLYALKAVTSAGVRSALSNPDLATTVTFTDSPLQPGVTTVKAAHLQELRTAVNAVRTLAGLPAASWSDPSPSPGVTILKAAHIAQLRTALDAARQALGFAPVAYTEPTVAPGSTTVKAAHISELRLGVY
jgi:hypothetical protein